MVPERPASGNPGLSEALGKDPTEHRIGARSVKREQAALLWRLLPKAFRRTVARHLALSDLVELNDAYGDYRARSRAGRSMVDLGLRADLRQAHSGWPTIVSLLLGLVGCGLFFLHAAWIPAMDDLTRITIFVPALLGVIAPLTLYLIPRYRLMSLFRVSISTEAAAAVFLSFLGLLWMLFFIGEGQPSFGRRPGGITLVVLCLGAVTAPLLEEVLFRELIPSIFGTSPHWFGHLASATLFALAHLPPDFSLFGQYLLAGLFLSVARLYSGGLVYPFAIHALANLIHQTLF